MLRRHPCWTTALAVGLALLLVEDPVRADDPTAQLKAMRREIDELRRSEAEKQRRLDALERQLEQLQQSGATAPAAATAPPVRAVVTPAATAADTAADSALDRALEESAQPSSVSSPSDIWSRQFGGTRLRLLDISLDTLMAAGTSTATDDQLGGQLQAGGHDPLRRGFTLQQAELSLTGAVDPYLTAEAHIIYTPDVVELEEAFMTTSSLPYGLQLELGQMLTEFGLINPSHPHAWDWIDQPVINSRLFGPDGLRSPGARLGWLTPLPWFSELHLGIQNANQGETTVSFVSEEGIGERPAVARSVHNLGDLLYLARWENFVPLGEVWGVKAGISGLHGPNNTGADGQTWIYGGDFKLRWRPADNFRGWPFFAWQTEVSKRDYTASYFVPGTAEEPSDGGHSHDDEPEAEEPPADPIPGDILRDYGFYTQLLYGFHYGWAAGARFEYATGNGQSAGGRENDALRDDRYRLSPLLIWQPTEFSRFRLQYNYDNARFLPERDAHTVWLGAEVLYGMHPAHKY